MGHWRIGAQCLESTTGRLPGSLPGADPQTPMRTSIALLALLALCLACHAPRKDAPAAGADDLTAGRLVFSDDFEYNFQMSEATWKIVVTNSGQTPLKDVTLTDSNGYDFGATFDLAVGASPDFVLTAPRGRVRGRVAAPAAARI